jgi:hypothetical protein
MNRIQFLKDTATAKLDIPEKTIVVYRDGFNLPKLDADYIEFEKYKIAYDSIDCKFMVIVGLNRIINPANRCDFIHEHLTTLTPNIPKVSIDTLPWIGEPWRLYYHYQYSRCGKFGANYSYPIEGEWQKWFYRESNDSQISGKNVRLLIESTYSDLDPLDATFELTEPTEKDIEWYAQVKDQVFAKYDTPKMLVNNLLKLANAHFGLDVTFDSFRAKSTENLFGAKSNFFKVPDLGIYRFMVEENRRRLDTFNAIIRP